MMDKRGEREPHDYEPDYTSPTTSQAFFACRICGQGSRAALHEVKVAEDEAAFNKGGK